jgi:hypothetical protein
MVFSAPVTLGLLENFPAFFNGVYRPFDSGHFSFPPSNSLIRNQRADILLFRLANVAYLAQVSFPLGGFLVEDMAFISLAPLILPDFVMSKRLAEALWVFCFGIGTNLQIV